MIKLQSVYERPDRCTLLFDLLKERDDTVNISHKVLPSWSDHVRFVESIPYRAWYFICDPGPVGACYLSKNNEIGVFIFRNKQGLGYGYAAVKELIKRHGPGQFIANINPRNEKSLKLFKGHGFKEIQHTLALTT